MSNLDELQKKIADAPIRYNFARWGVFSTADASAILGITRREVLLFTEQKLVVPSLVPEGRGQGLRFSFLDLLRMYVAMHLKRMGIAPRYLRYYTAEIREDAKVFTSDGDVIPNLTFTFNDEGRPVIYEVYSRLRDMKASGQEGVFMSSAALEADRELEFRTLIKIPVQKLFKELEESVELHFGRK